MSERKKGNEREFVRLRGFTLIRRREKHLREMEKREIP